MFADRNPERKKAEESGLPLTCMEPLSLSCAFGTKARNFPGRVQAFCDCVNKVSRRQATLVFGSPEGPAVFQYLVAALLHPEVKCLCAFSLETFLTLIAALCSTQLFEKPVRPWSPFFPRHPLQQLLELSLKHMG